MNRRHMMAASLGAAWQLSCASRSSSGGATSDPSNPNPIPVASIFSLSGEARDDNLGAVEGVRFAVEEVNARGGVLGSQLKLIEVDNQSTVQGSRAAAEKAVELGVAAIVGASWSEHSLAVAEVAQRSQVPMITNVSTHPDVTLVGDYIFRTCFTDPYQGQVLANFACDRLQAKSAVSFAQESGDYSMGLEEVFKAKFLQRGGQVLKSYRYRLDEADFSGIGAEVAELKPDVLFIPGHHESARIIKQMRAAGVYAVPLGGDGWGTPGFRAEGGDTIDRAYFATHWSNEDPSQTSREFVKKYRGVPNAPTALAQDAVGILVASIERASSTSAQALRDAISRTKSYAGVTGEITFDEKGDPVGKAAVIIEIGNGQERFFTNAS